MKQLRSKKIAFLQSPELSSSSLYRVLHTAKIEIKKEVE
jgi:hypothetical protein